MVFTRRTDNYVSHSDLVDGTFTLEYTYYDTNGNPISEDKNFNHNTGESTVQEWIRARHYLFQKVEVNRQSQYGCDYSCTWMIKWQGFGSFVNQSTPHITVKSYTDLTGGAANTQPTVELVSPSHREYNQDRLIYRPIDYQFGSRIGTKPGIEVKVNNIPAVCLMKDCGYTYNDFGAVSSVSYDAGTKAFTFSIAASNGATFTTNDVQIEVQGRTCVVDTATDLGSLQFTVATADRNTDGSITMTAPSVVPKVYIPAYGTLDVTGSVTSTFAATSVTPNTDTHNGGKQAVIAGTGFPEDKSKITVTLCS